MSNHKPSLYAILSEATHVITSNSGHFSILSLVLLFPISITVFIYLVLQNSASAPNPDSIFNASTPQSETPFYLLYLLVFIVFTVILSLCGTVSITYSAFQGYYNRPVRVITSLKAILHSFFPLLATQIVAQLILYLITFAYAGLTFLLYNFLVLLGVDLDYDSSNLIILVAVMIVFLLIMFVYFGVEWYLSRVIVVIESKWGFAPLKRSSYLVKGIRGILLGIMILFSAISVLLSVLSVRVVANAGGRFTSWEFLMQMTILAVLLTLYSLYAMVTNVVVYVHCKELHGEFEISGSEYVRLGGEYEQIYSGVDVV